jgi:hypothetical protein
VQSEGNHVFEELRCSQKSAKQCQEVAAPQIVMHNQIGAVLLYSVLWLTVVSHADTMCSSTSRFRLKAPYMRSWEALQVWWSNSIVIQLVFLT